jgi:hypothetical protein
MAPNRHSVGDHHPVRRAGAIPCLLLLVSLLFGSQALAVEYPVDGVWVALNPAFPAAEYEICFAVRTFGVAAVLRKSVSEIMIFSRDRRYDLKGDIQKQATASSVKPGLQGYRITETLKRRHGWLGFRRKVTYLLAIVDSRRIEIRNNLGVRRYVKCGHRKSTI